MASMENSGVLLDRCIGRAGPSPQRRAKAAAGDSGKTGIRRRQADVPARCGPGRLPPHAQRGI